MQAKRRQKIERLRQKNSEPPLSDLDERRRELLLMPMRAALCGEPFDPAANDRLLAETERQMEEAGGCPDPDAAVPYRCGRCRDTGYLKDGEMCGCMRKRIYTDVFGAYDIDALTGSFEAFDLSLFDNKKKMEKLKNLLTGFAAYRDRDVITLSGSSGVGTTFLLSSLAKRAEQTEDCLLYTSRCVEETGRAPSAAAHRWVPMPSSGRAHRLATDAASAILWR